MSKKAKTKKVKFVTKVVYRFNPSTGTWTSRQVASEKKVVRVR